MTVPFTKFDGLYIGARWVPTQSGDREAVINPANEDVIGQAPVGGAVEAEAAIVSAREAFDSGVWSEKPLAERTEILRRMHSALNARAEQIKALMIVEGGVTGSSGACGRPP